MARTKVYTREESQNFKNVPEALKLLPNWVCWRTQPRENNKPAKIPVTPREPYSEAKINDPASWGTYGESIDSFDKNQQLLGIGFVFSTRDSFTGIDIDDCRDPITEELTPAAEAIVSTFKSYTEVSPSGTGVKIFIEGHAPGQRQRRGGIEIYSHSHYFTLTGRHLEGTPKTVERRQGPLADLYQQIFGKETQATAVSEKNAKNQSENNPILEKVRAINDDQLILMAAAHSPKFRLLWEGNHDGFPSQSEADFALTCRLVFWTHGDKERIDRLFRRSGLYRPKWDRLGENTIIKALEKEPGRYDPTRIEDNEPVEKNDIWIANRFSLVFEDKYIFVKEWEEWMKWAGTHWERNMKNDLHNVIATSMSAELKERARKSDPDQFGKEMNWAIKVGTSKVASAVESLLRAPMSIASNRLDNNTMVLAVENGVIDLKTGKLKDTQPSDYITRIANITYDPEAKCPRWEQFLEEIMCGDAEMVRYLWRVLGYCLTGETREHAFFILHGGGCNGKSTFIEILKAMMSGYAQSARFQTFLARGAMGASSANDDIAHMASSRVVVALESDEASKLDSALVKNLTGGDTVRARFLYSGEFEYKPRLKLFLVSNYVPRIEDTSDAIWRRIHYIPFKYKVPKAKIDPTLSLNLFGELEGILARAVLGCIEWQEIGLAPPPGVVKPTENLRQESDLLGAALAEITVDGLGLKTKHKDLLEAITTWFQENNYRYAPKTHQLIKELRRRGFEDKRESANLLYWHGIGLRVKAQYEVEI